MQMKGLDISSTIRLIQPSEPNATTDILVDQITNTAGVFQENFYALLFFDMLNGITTGVSGGSITPGMYMTLSNTAGAVVATTNIVALDWYETETSYVSEAVMTATLTPSSNMYIATSAVYYIANKSDVAETLNIYTSDALAKSLFAVSDGGTPAKNGVLISSAGGNLIIDGSLKFTISK